MVESEKRQRDRKTEKAIFQDRTKEISTLLAIPEISPLFQGLPKNPKLLDLFTGTGAGAQAVYDRLKKLGNRPEEITMVDIFMLLNRLDPDPVGFFTAKYSSGIEETKRNMEGLSRKCYINICKGDALDYVQSVETVKDGAQLRFDLITAFSAPDVLCSPLRDGRRRILPSILRIIYEHGNIPTIYTFGSVNDRWMDQLNSHLITEYDPPLWNLYAKPEGIGHPDWDKWILTNRQLELERFGPTRYPSIANLGRNR